MANNTLIGAIRAEATLESGKFVDGAKKIRQESKATETQVKKSFGSMSSSIRSSSSAFPSFVKGFIGALSVGLIARAGKAALDYASNLKTVSQQLGVSTRDLQLFRYAATQNNITQADADKGLQKLALSMSQAASGSKPMIAAFKSVGVEVADIKNKGPVELFGKIADGMNKQGGAAKNAAAGAKLMGEGFQKFIPLASQGSAGINELSQAAQRLGIVLSDEQIQRADETANKLDDIKTVLSAQIAGVVTQNANSILSLSQALATLTSSIVSFLNSNPQLALGIIGGLAGSRFGIVGAAAGVIGGATLGNKIALSQSEQRLQQKAIPLIRHNLQKENAELKRQIAAGGAKQGQVDKVRRLTARLNAATGNTPPARLPGAPPPFLATPPKTGGGGGRSRTARQPRDRSDDVTYQFQREQMQADADILRAKQAMAQSSVDRLNIELQLIELERQMQDAEINDRVRRAQRDRAEGKITESALQQVEAQAAVLKEKNDQVARLRTQAAIDERQRLVEEDTYRLANEKRDLAIGDLQAAAQLAETQSERRTIQMQILDAMLEQKRLELEHEKQLAVRNGATQQEIDAIQAKIDHIGAERAQGTAAIMQGTRGPWEDYLASLPTTAAKAQEALEQLEVQGFEGLIDAALALSEGFDNAKDALLNTLKQFLLGLARMQLQNALGGLFKGGSNPLSFLGGLFGGGVTPGGPASFGGGAENDVLFGSGSIPLFAGGGSFTMLGRPGVDRNVLSMNGIPIARVSYGERATISSNDNGSAGTHMGGGRGWFGDMNVYTNDADSFRRNDRQIARQWNRRLSRA
jgi:hypothetical protein